MRAHHGSGVASIASDRDGTITLADDQLAVEAVDGTNTGGEIEGPGDLHGANVNAVDFSISSTRPEVALDEFESGDEALVHLDAAHSLGVRAITLPAVDLATVAAGVSLARLIPSNDWVGLGATFVAKETALGVTVALTSIPELYVFFSRDTEEF